jgi:hypothetical protein
MNNKEHNLTGQVFGKLTVIKKAASKNGRTFWECICSCGNKKDIRTSSLLGGTLSCGCKNRQNFVGQKQNLLTVIGSKIIDKKRLMLECRCDCGKITIVTPGKWLSGHTKSCGCYKISQNPQMTSATRVYKRYKDGNLELNEFLILVEQQCYYCKELPKNKRNTFLHKGASQYAKDNGDFIYNGLDRVNNNLPHNKDNVVPCCKWCNFAKSNKTVEEFLDDVYRFMIHQCKIDKEILDKVYSALDT